MASTDAPLKTSATGNAQKTPCNEETPRAGAAAERTAGPHTAFSPPRNSACACTLRPVTEPPDGAAQCEVQVNGIPYGIVYYSTADGTLPELVSITDKTSSAEAAVEVLIQILPAFTSMRDIVLRVTHEAESDRTIVQKNKSPPDNAVGMSGTAHLAQTPYLRSTANNNMSENASPSAHSSQDSETSCAPLRTNYHCRFYDRLAEARFSDHSLVFTIEEAPGKLALERLAPLKIQRACAAMTRDAVSSESTQSGAQPSKASGNTNDKPPVTTTAHGQAKDTGGAEPATTHPQNSNYRTTGSLHSEEWLLGRTASEEARYVSPAVSTAAHAPPSGSGHTAAPSTRPAATNAQASAVKTPEEQHAVSTDPKQQSNSGAQNTAESFRHTNDSAAASVTAPSAATGRGTGLANPADQSPENSEVHQSQAPENKEAGRAPQMGGQQPSQPREGQAKPGNGDAPGTPTRKNTPLPPIVTDQPSVREAVNRLRDAGMKNAAIAAGGITNAKGSERSPAEPGSGASVAHTGGSASHGHVHNASAAHSENGDSVHTQRQPAQSSAHTPAAAPAAHSHASVPRPASSVHSNEPAQSSARTRRPAEASEEELVEDSSSSKIGSIYAQIKEAAAQESSGAQVGNSRAGESFRSGGLHTAQPSQPAGTDTAVAARRGASAGPDRPAGAVKDGSVQAQAVSAQHSLASAATAVTRPPQAAPTAYDIHDTPTAGSVLSHGTRTAQRSAVQNGQIGSAKPLSDQAETDTVRTEPLPGAAHSASSKASVGAPVTQMPAKSSLTQESLSKRTGADSVQQTSAVHAVSSAGQARADLRTTIPSQSETVPSAPAHFVVEPAKNGDGPLSTRLATAEETRQQPAPLQAPEQPQSLSEASTRASKHYSSEANEPSEEFIVDESTGRVSRRPLRSMKDSTSEENSELQRPRAVVVEKVTTVSSGTSVSHTGVAPARSTKPAASLNGSEELKTAERAATQAMSTNDAAHPSMSLKSHPTSRLSKLQTTAAAPSHPSATLESHRQPPLGEPDREETVKSMAGKSVSDRGVASQMAEAHQSTAKDTAQAESAKGGATKSVTASLNGQREPSVKLSTAEQDRGGAESTKDKPREQPTSQQASVKPTFSKTAAQGPPQSQETKRTAGDSIKEPSESEKLAGQSQASLNASAKKPSTASSVSSATNRPAVDMAQMVSAPIGKPVGIAEESPSAHERLVEAPQRPSASAMATGAAAAAGAVAAVPLQKTAAAEPATSERSKHAPSVTAKPSVSSYNAGKAKSTVNQEIAPLSSQIPSITAQMNAMGSTSTRNDIERQIRSQGTAAAQPGGSLKEEAASNRSQGQSARFSTGSPAEPPPSKVPDSAQGKAAASERQGTSLETVYPTHPPSSAPSQSVSSRFAASERFAASDTPSTIPFAPVVSSLDSSLPDSQLCAETLVRADAAPRMSIAVAPPAAAASTVAQSTAPLQAHQTSTVPMVLAFAPTVATGNPTENPTAPVQASQHSEPDRRHVTNAANSAAHASAAGISQAPSTSTVSGQAAHTSVQTAMPSEHPTHAAFLSQHNGQPQLIIPLQILNNGESPAMFQAQARPLTEAVPSTGGAPADVVKPAATAVATARSSVRPVTVQGAHTASRAATNGVPDESVQVTVGREADGQVYVVRIAIPEGSAASDAESIGGTYICTCPGCGEAQENEAPHPCGSCGKLRGKMLIVFDDTAGAPRVEDVLERRVAPYGPLPQRVLPMDEAVQCVAQQGDVAAQAAKTASARATESEAKRAEAAVSSTRKRGAASTANAVSSREEKTGSEPVNTASAQSAAQTGAATAPRSATHTDQASTKGSAKQPSASQAEKSAPVLTAVKSAVEAPGASTGAHSEQTAGQEKGRVEKNRKTDAPSVLTGEAVTMKAPTTEAQAQSLGSTSVPPVAERSTSAVPQNTKTQPDTLSVGSARSVYIDYAEPKPVKDLIAFYEKISRGTNNSE